MSETMTIDAAEQEGLTGTVAIGIEQHIALLSAAAFARDVLAACRMGPHLQSDAVLDLAGKFGLHQRRPFSEDELADPDTIIAVLGIDVDHPYVHEISPILDDALAGFELEAGGASEDDAE